jgi:hypothetical protein
MTKGGENYEKSTEMTKNSMGMTKDSGNYKKRAWE